MLPNMNYSKSLKFDLVDRIGEGCVTFQINQPNYLRYIKSVNVGDCIKAFQSITKTNRAMVKQLISL